MRDIPEVWLFRARQAIASGDDPQPAAVAFVRAADRTADLWAASQIRSWTPDPGYIGAILLAGEGDRVATAYERVVMSEGRDDVLMVDVPETERSVFDWTMIGWLRLLRRDWRTLPDLDIEVAEYRRIKNLLAALAADDAAGLEAALDELIDFEPRRPTILAAALAPQSHASQLPTEAEPGSEEAW